MTNRKFKKKFCKITKETRRTSKAYSNFNKLLQSLYNNNKNKPHFSIFTHTLF